MALLTIRPNGLSLTEPPAVDRPVTFGRRGAITGWTRQSAQRHKRWLQSVDADVLDGFGYAVTLTTKLQATGPEELYGLLHHWWNRQLGRGALRAHWVRENHADGRPHFHLGVFYARRLSKREEALVARDWVEVARQLLPRTVGQDVKPMDHRGWSQYCAKHSTRSVSSYQRQGLPRGWSKSGRLWGHFGEWTVREDRYVVDAHTYVALRRMLLDWRRGDAEHGVARAQQALVGARSARGRRQAAHHVKCAEARLSAVGDMERNALRTRRGLSEWTARADALDMLRRAADQVNGLVLLVEESADQDGQVQGWRIIREGVPGRVDLDELRTAEPDGQPNASTPDRDALVQLYSPSEPSSDTIAAGVMFAQERKRRRAQRRKAAPPAAGRVAAQHGVIAQPGVSLARRDRSRELLGLAV